MLITGDTGIDDALDSDGDGVADVIENVFGSDCFSFDTDGDGVSDYIEIYVTGTEVCIPDGDLDTDNDGLTNKQESVYGTHAADRDSDGDGLEDGYEIFFSKSNPLDVDTDGDTLYDGIEIDLNLNPNKQKTSGGVLDSETLAAKQYFAETTHIISQEVDNAVDILSTSDDPDYDGRENSIDTYPSSNSFGGILYTTYDGTQYTANVSYKMDYRWFFNQDNLYNPDLAVMSSLLSANVYSNNYIYVRSGGILALTSGSGSAGLFMNFHGMYPRRTYRLTNADNHITDMIVGSREVTYNGITKHVVCVVIRGTDGSLEEWSSNFDIGTTVDSHSEWINESNHKGFEITVNRLNVHLTSYISEYLPGEPYCLWITGHSRGGAIANILAVKRDDIGDSVYAYTFASPCTTTATLPASFYNSIFNIVNTDDYVAHMPMSAWGFKRYGIDKTASVYDYEASWLSLMGIDYNPDLIGMNAVLNELSGISTSRNNCYVERSGLDGHIRLTYTYEVLRNDAILDHVELYPSNTVGTYRMECGDAVGLYSLYIYHQPAFLMQTLAAVMGGEMSPASFAVLDVAPYLENAKLGIISASLDGIDHPHYIESYYLLATKLT